LACVTHGTGGTLSLQHGDVGQKGAAASKHDTRVGQISASLQLPVLEHGSIPVEFAQSMRNAAQPWYSISKCALLMLIVYAYEGVYVQHTVLHPYTLLHGDTCMHTAGRCSQSRKQARASRTSSSGSTTL